MADDSIIPPAPPPPPPIPASAPSAPVSVSTTTSATTTTNGAKAKVEIIRYLAAGIFGCIASEAVIAVAVAHFGASDWTIVNSIVTGINSVALVLAGAIAKAGVDRV